MAQESINWFICVKLSFYQIPNLIIKEKKWYEIIESKKLVHGLGLGTLFAKSRLTIITWAAISNLAISFVKDTAIIPASSLNKRVIINISKTSKYSEQKISPLSIIISVY